MIHLVFDIRYLIRLCKSGFLSVKVFWGYFRSVDRVKERGCNSSRTMNESLLLTKLVFNWCDCLSLGEGVPGIIPPGHPCERNAEINYGYK